MSRLALSPLSIGVVSDYLKDALLRYYSTAYELRDHEIAAEREVLLRAARDRLLGAVRRGHANVPAGR